MSGFDWQVEAGGGIREGALYMVIKSIHPPLSAKQVDRIRAAFEAHWNGEILDHFELAEAAGLDGVRELETRFRDFVFTYQ